MIHSLLVLLAGLLVLVPATVATAETGAPPPEASAEVERYLSALGRRPETSATVEGRLLELGPPALPPLFRALTGLGPRNTEARREVVIRVIIAAAAEDRRAALRAMAVGDVALADRIRALRVLEEIGQPEDVAVFLEIAASVEFRQMRSGGIRACLRRTARVLLERGPRIPDGLSTAWSGVAPAIRILLLDALVDLGGRRAFVDLGILLRTGTGSAAILDRLARLPVVVGEQNGLVPGRSILAALLAPDADTLRAGCVAAGRFQLAEAFDRLAGLLDSASPEVRRAARHALRNLTGVDLGPEGASWVSWKSREETWSRDGLPSALERLGGDDPGAILAALRDLERRRIHRDRIVGPTAALLDHDRPGVRAAACRTLGRLGSPASLAPLAAALDDVHPEARAAADGALRAITGRREAGDQRTWRRRLALSAPEGS